MWPWAKNEDSEVVLEAEGSIEGFADGAFQGMRELVLAPRDDAAVRFERELRHLERRLGDAKSDTDMTRVGCETQKTLKEFGEKQRESVEKVIGDLDESLRDLVHVLEESMDSSEHMVDRASGATGRLAAAAESKSLEELRRAVVNEVRELVESVKEYRESTEEIQRTYKKEIVQMQGRLLKAQETARTDSLTKLPNRVAHEFYLSAIIKKAQDGTTYSLAILDLDGFKQINDAYGHKAGDLALCDFAARAKALGGKSCYLARLGGDEFVIVSTLDLSRLEALLETLKAKLTDEPLVMDGYKIPYSVSFGITPVDGRLRYTELMAEADERMYKYKRKNKRAA